MKLNAEDICLEENGMICLCPDEEEKNNDVAVKAQADLIEYSLFILNMYCP